MQPKEATLLINPTSGKGRGARAGAAALTVLRDAGWRVRALTSRSGQDAAEIAERCVAEGVESLVVTGGDGMINLVIQALADSGIPLGIIPSGTGNDVARTFGLPRTDARAAARRVIEGSPHSMDLVRAGDRYYATVMAAGFDAVVNERANAMTWPRGQMRYNIATVAELRTFRPLSYVIEVDGTSHRTDAMLVAVGNCPSFGGGLRIAEGAEPDDGLLDVIVIKPVSKLELVKTYPKLFKGTHTTHRAYERIRGSEITIAAPGIVAYADGERFGPLPLTLACAPRALEVLR